MIDYPFEKSPTVLYGEMIDGELRAQAGLPDLRFFNAGFLFAHGGDGCRTRGARFRRRLAQKSRLLYSTCISIDISMETTRAILDRIPPVTHADTARPAAALDLHLI